MYSISRITFLLICALILNEAIGARAQYQHTHRHREKSRDRETKKYTRVVHPCEQSSCYPATGNLLIGRENRLYASSTCGTKSPERYCIVSHLEEKKCFLCDTRPETWEDPLKNHRIGQMIYTTKPGTNIPSSWQSENGRENVTIQLDLEAEFHFTHLIIIFATFRPAAMLIERSYDFGKSWHVYRYFAHNCEDSFPGVPTELRNITDVVCDNRYSSVEPSKNGEVIFRVLPPNMKVVDPYAKHVQNMLRVTNLRVNFTRLHNLGDTLLDDRQEIHEKYYYAISQMIIRGSCSCYGHASRCLPLEGTTSSDYDMVHGRCECTHNTKGLNCEECEDFFNDLPWKPALGKQTNACKKCNCNNHANSCHFDEVVFEKSGSISGGVCDNCQHNTQGQHCEECIPFFYRDPNEDIQSPYVCKPCDCDPNGALDEGICDSLAEPDSDAEPGACHCKTFVKGRRCDQCKDGYWNLTLANPQGCEECTCNILGTVDNSGCNMHTGECICKRLVTGKDCNQCMPETYGLSDSLDGCSPCNCHPGGAIDNHCDVLTGQCRCRSNMSGRMCDIPVQNHYIPPLVITVEAELVNPNECSSFSNQQGCSKYMPPRDRDREPSHTGPGYIRVPENSELEITVNQIPKTMPYDIQIRYQTQTRGDWEVAHITLIRPDEVAECTNSHPTYETYIPFSLPEYSREVIAMREICLEKDKVYKFRINFEQHRQNEDNPVAQILIDSLVIVPRIDLTELFTPRPGAESIMDAYVRLGCNMTLYDMRYAAEASDRCREINVEVSTIINDGASQCACDPTGSLSKQCDSQGGGYCQCKPNVVNRKCDQCAPGTYGFGPEGCKACDCNSIGSKDNNCDQVTGQCSCHPNTYGRECDQCQPGYWNFPNCEICQCNGHAQTCDAKTGQCLNCLDYTTGYNCDLCLDGYYGDPLLGSAIGCRPCRCPDTIASNNSHAEACHLDRRNNNMQCICKEGYSGPRCDSCADNYFGNPEQPGGSCSPCDCSNNIDLYQSGNCDGKTGQCLRCLYETTGDNCEHCQDGFYGNALQQNCIQCDCDFLGTNGTIAHCDRETGQCPCLKNVQGMRCDQCIENHWKIASGEGCEACDCDPIGSDSEQCNPYDGQCSCRAGFGGRQCNQCQTNYWGNPNDECIACECDEYGSLNRQCNRETGQCECLEGIGGYKCTECARGFIGHAPHCSSCGECFNNWDLILKGLEEATVATIQRAKQIKTVGATGAYTADFGALDTKLKSIQQLLDNTTVSLQDINLLDKEALDLKEKLQASHKKLSDSERELEKVYSNLSVSTVELQSLRNQSQQIKQLSEKLKESGIELQESNIEGALNLTRNAYNRVNALSAIKEKAQGFGSNTERQCKRVEALATKIKNEVNQGLLKNDEIIADYRNQLGLLSANIPEMNNDVCDKRGDPCDNLCGGAGCGTCGGLSCEKGAVTLTEKALKVAKDAEGAIKSKKEEADATIRALFQAKQTASDARGKAKMAHENAEIFLNSTNEHVRKGEQVITQLNDFIRNETASPAESKKLAQDALELDLTLEPEEIKKLGHQINEAVNSLQNVESIILDTRFDLDRVNKLKHKANETKQKAEAILNVANNVVKNLQEAEESQLKAQEAIRQAHSNIELAAEDLEKIDQETAEAEDPANQTAQRVDNLLSKINRLQRNTAQNDLDAKDFKTEALKVKDSASSSLLKSAQLRADAENANESLSSRALKSEKARLRAKQLLKRASELTVDTNEKLRELQDMQTNYHRKDEQLEKLKSQIKPLNDQMTMYLSNIQHNAERYRQCI